MQAFDRNTPLPEERLRLLFDIGDAAEAGDVRRDAGRCADLQLQRRQQGRDRRVRRRGQAQRQSA